MARFDALAFDMDGVLVDSEPLHLEATRSVLKPEGVEVSWEVFTEYVGTTVVETWSDLVGRYRLKGRLDDYLRRYEEAVLKILARKLEPKPGVWALIDVARRRGTRLALASSSRQSWITATLAALAMENVFEVVVSGESVAHGKPAPDIYLETARRLGVSPRRCVAIEDAPKGIVAAKSAGMYAVGVRTAYNDEVGLAPADTILKSLEEFDLSLLDTGNGRA